MLKNPSILFKDDAAVIPRIEATLPEHAVNGKAAPGGLSRHPIPDVNETDHAVDHEYCLHPHAKGGEWVSHASTKQRKEPYTPQLRRIVPRMFLATPVSNYQV